MSRDAASQTDAADDDDVVDIESDDEPARSPPKTLPRAHVEPPADAAALKATARVLFAELSLLTEGRDKYGGRGVPPFPAVRTHAIVPRRHYKTDVRVALARAGWRVNDASNQELGAKPPAGWRSFRPVPSRASKPDKHDL